MNNHVKNGAIGFVSLSKYKDFLTAYDDIEVCNLSDEDLQAYHDLCENGVIDANEELRRRDKQH